jgi:hypothetical protein
MTGLAGAPGTWPVDGAAAAHDDHQVDPIDKYLQRQPPPADEVSEDIDPVLLGALERVPDLRARFEAVKLGAPLLGSLQAGDLQVPQGSLVGDIAHVKLSFALDHLRTVRHLLVEARWMPTDAHLTLLRPVFEGAVQARWLLDPSATPQMRVSRAYGALLADLEEQRKIEQEASGDPDWPKQASGWAVARTQQRKQEAIAACLLPEHLTTIDLLERYGLQPHHRDAVLFRQASGILHSQTWAAIHFGEDVVVGQTATRRDTIHYADQQQAAQMAAAAVDLFEAALSGYETYVDPAAENRPE